MQGAWDFIQPTDKPIAGLDEKVKHAWKRRGGFSWSAETPRQSSDHRAGFPKENLGGRFTTESSPNGGPEKPKDSPTGRPGEFNPARKNLIQSTSARTPLPAPNLIAAPVWKSTVSVLRLLGSSGRISAYHACDGHRIGRS